MNEDRQYLQALRVALPNRSEAEIELAIASNLQWRKYIGLPAEVHRRRGMELLFPSRSWHDWRLERLASVEYCIQNGIQELAWMGSASSGKSGDMADIAVALWMANPRNTTIYVTSPYKDATERGVWAGIVEQFSEAKSTNPMLPGILRTSMGAIILDERAHPRSFIRVVSVDEVGKMKGKKAISQDEGLIIVLVDEFPDFPEMAGQNFMKVLENLTSNRNLLVIAAGNFTSISDSFARFTDPDENDIPEGWYGFNPDKHFRWRTKRGGLALRFDGLQSPNVRAGRDIFPFLTRIEFIQRAAARPGGLESPDAMREVRSAPVTSLDEYTVTNPERIKAGHAKDPYSWTSDEIIKGAFCDFGLGGDACIVQKFKLGWMPHLGGRKQILALWDAPFEIEIRVGSAIPVMDQAALGLKRYCEAAQLRPENVGYDAAMRPGLAAKVSLLYSPLCKAIDSDGPATDRPVPVEFTRTKQDEPEKRVTWKDAVDRLLSEFWFAVSCLIDSQQMRGLELSPKGIEQLCTRRWERAGRKKKVQTKKEYRELLKSMGRAQESPNEADSIAGCVEMARRLGLQLDALAPGGGSLQMVLQMIRDRGMRANIDFAQRREHLPSGKLHAIKAEKHTPPGRLHRRL